MPGVLIVGAGPAGLTLARSLSRQRICVRVFDSATHRDDRGLGIWNRAQAALRSLGIWRLFDDPLLSLALPPAAYRSRDGAWLSRCSRTPTNARRVQTLRESSLLRALEAELPEGAVRRGAAAAVTHVVEEGGGVRLSLADGTEVCGVALVAADGPASPVRAALWPAAEAQALSTGCF